MESTKVVRLDRVTLSRLKLKCGDVPVHKYVKELVDRLETGDPASEAALKGSFTFGDVKLAIDQLRQTVETLAKDLVDLKDKLKPMLKDFNLRMLEREIEFQEKICCDGNLDYDKETDQYNAWLQNYSYKQRSPEEKRREECWHELAEKGLAPLLFECEPVAAPLSFTDWLVKRSIGIKDPGKDYESREQGS